MYLMLHLKSFVSQNAFQSNKSFHFPPRIAQESKLSKCISALSQKLFWILYFSIRK